MIIVIDTNSWIQTRLLGTPLASSLIHKVVTENHVIAMSDAQRQELEITATRKLAEHETTARNHLEKIKQYMGVVDSVRYPTREDVKARIESRLKELGSSYKEVVCTQSQVISAKERVFEQLPPNGPEDQQFKDSVIWESILDLLDCDDVLFITKDGGFFEGRDHDKGLAKELLKEVEAKQHSIKTHKEISDFLKQEQLPKPDKDKIAQSISSHLCRSSSDTFQFGANEMLDPELESYEIKAFLTETPAKLAIEFFVTFHSLNLVNHETGLRVEGVVGVKGFATWDSREQQIESVSIDERGIQSPEGMGRHVYIHASTAFSGRVREKNVFKHPLK